MSELHLPNRIRQLAASQPSAPAVTAEGTTLTYAEFDSYTNKVATALTTLATSPGRRCTAPHGSARRGGIRRLREGRARLHPHQLAAQPDEIAWIAADAQLGVLIVEADFADAARAVADALPDVRVIVVGEAASMVPQLGRDGRIRWRYRSGPGR